MNSTNNKFHITLLLLTTFLLSFQTVTYSIDTIKTNQIFRDGEALISSGGTFELGFFSPGTSRNRYVGIWYRTITVSSIVWVANRELPVTNTSVFLKVNEPGILILQDDGNDTIWSTNATKSVTTPVAQLLDSGNLVVKDADNDNPENYLWQSFNYPTDTLLPGMKLGWNLTTRSEYYLSSWRSSDDPAPGDYTYHCDPTGYPQNVVRRRGVKHYRTEPWNGLRFSGYPNLYIKNAVYYELMDNSVISRFMLNPSGVTQGLTWIDRTQVWVVLRTSPTDNCDTYKLCGAYGTCNVVESPLCGCLDRFVPRDPDNWGRSDWSDGCVRRKPLDCQHGDRFLMYSGIKLPDTNVSRYNESLTLEECKVLCSSNCSCMAYTSLNISNGGSGCLVWYGDLVDIKELFAQGQDIYIRMSSCELELSADSKGKKREILIVSLSLVMGTIVLALCMILYAYGRKKISNKLKRNGRLGLGFISKAISNHTDEKGNKDLELPEYDLHTITRATDNFSIENKLGEGGFEPVYKGVLEDGQDVAVKRLSRTSRQGVDEFKNEVMCIAKLQHRNLVKLLGFCIEGEENMLLYEYLTNKSLDYILFDPIKSKLLDWPKRFHIINGIARGLMYLHQDSRLRIIHKDLKAGNILLDSDMNPKISDFGLARAFGGNETGANTNRVVGTHGYMAPEYVQDGLFSVKSDVFGFGVIVLEIVSGKRNRGFSHIDHSFNLLGHAWMLYREGRSLELVDSFLGHSEYLTEVLRSIHIGLLCVQQCLKDRPTMSSVVLMLGHEGVLPQAKQPGFFTGRDIANADSSVSSTEAITRNEMTITLLEGR